MAQLPEGFEKVNVNASIGKNERNRQVITFKESPKKEETYDTETLLGLTDNMSQGTKGTRTTKKSRMKGKP